MKKRLMCGIIASMLLLSGCGSGNYKSGSTDMVTNEMVQDGDMYLRSEALNDVAGGTENFNTEEYSAITEDGYKSVALNPLSTFSADVDTASYSNIRRMINAGNEIPEGAVRIEEMLNYFQYDYNEPNGDEPFGVTTEIGVCPWNEDTQLMLIGLQAEKIDLENAPESNLVFLIDTSGSMDSADKLPLVKKAFKILSEGLKDNDRVSIVTYAGSETVALEGADGKDAMEINRVLEEMMAGGSTNGEGGIKKAYELAEKYYIKGGNNRVILATDGDLNVGVTDESSLKGLVEEKKKSGVFLSVLGFGTGNIKDNKMETLADNGDGNYSYIDSELEARKVLAEEMGATLHTVAKDVKLQVEFNPEKVKGYRLIGYENRLLNAEDFEDDTKDGGEIGSGHRVTALYEIVPVNSPMEIKGTELKYQQSESTGAEELLNVAIRYKEPDGDESKLMEVPVYSPTCGVVSDDFVFAGCVAEFGMLLRDSEYKGTSSYNGILKALGDINIEEDGYKEEFKELVKKARSIYD